MDALIAIKRRRSIRNFTGAKIPRADLETIVDAGRWAPSGHNVQPWDFIVITDEAMLQELAVVGAWIVKAAAVVAVVLDESSDFWVEDGAAAIENMLIAGTALGYGSCWLEGDTLVWEEHFKELLGVPVDKRLLTLIPFGLSVEWPDQEKRPLGDVLHWERFS